MEPYPPPSHHLEAPKSAKKIWFTALLPLGTLMLFIILLFIADLSDSHRVIEGMLIAFFWTQALITLFCWISFNIAINQRLQGPTKVILICFYPIIQIGLQFVIFFCGCLALIWADGGIF